MTRSRAAINGFLLRVLFSVPWQMERCCQMEGGLVERQLVQRRPQVQYVPLSAAVGLETLEDVLAVDRGLNEDHFRGVRGGRRGLPGKADGADKEREGGHWSVGSSPLRCTR